MGWTGATLARASGVTGRTVAFTRLLSSKLLMRTQKRCIGTVCPYPGTQIFAASITWHVLGKGKGSRVDVTNASPL